MLQFGILKARTTEGVKAQCLNVSPQQKSVKEKKQRSKTEKYH